MIIIETDFLLPKGYKAINLLGIFLIVRNENSLTEKTLNHESIHSAQYLELLIIFFLLWYGIEFLVRWIGNGFRDWNGCYHKISLEQEAYDNDDNPDYLKNQKTLCLV